MFDLLELCLGTLVRLVIVRWSRFLQARTASWLPSAAIAVVMFLPARPP
jgi:hypothetical protein